MADFRKFVPVLAVLALILGLGMTASAQVTAPFTCTATSAVPNQLRGEGITELVGDIVLDCTGGIPAAAGAPVQAVNVTIFLNTNVTSRILSGDPAAGTGVSEALLLIDEPAPGTNPATGMPFQTFCVTSSSGGTCPIPGTGNGVPYAAGGTFSVPVPGSIIQGVAYNAFLGVVRGSNSIVFFGVPIDPPGSNLNVHRVLRITNVRANASAIGLATGTAQPNPVTANVALSGPTSISVNNPTNVVGYVQQGLLFDTRKFDNSDAAGVTSFNQCSSPSQVGFMSLRYRENFPTAFKPRFRFDPTTGSFQNQPGAIYNSESGFFAPFAGVGGQAGVADFSTRVKVVFNNLPLGVSLWVARNASYGNSAAVATASEAGPIAPLTYGVLIGGEQAIAVPLTTTGTTQSGQVVWELLSGDPSFLDSVGFHVWLSFTGNPGAGSPGLGTGSVNGTFAPISTVTSAASAAPIPRFADKSTATDIFKNVICATNLLFPYVVSGYPNFDTGMAVANTTMDGFGTAAQSGKCTAQPYGLPVNLPPFDFVIPPGLQPGPIPAGQVGVALASQQIGPTFVGYVWVRCLFSYAHGFAYITNVGGTQVAHGYLALIVPDVGQRNPYITGNGGEQLLQ